MLDERPTVRTNWLLIAPHVTATPATAAEIAARCGFSVPRTLRSLIYARAHGLVHETFIPDHRELIPRCAYAMPQKER